MQSLTRKTFPARLGADDTEKTEEYEPTFLSQYSTLRVAATLRISAPLTTLLNPGPIAKGHSLL
jgi:hypothetical protein